MIQHHCGPASRATIASNPAIGGLSRPFQPRSWTKPDLTSQLDMPAMIRASLALSLLLTMTGVGRAQTPVATPADTCLKAGAGLSLGAKLPRVRAAIRERRPLKVVAIGSSSTRGVGASSWAATYPEVMQRELQRLVPGLSVDLVNSGINGETIPGQLARLDSDALQSRPDLVIWQLGGNDVIFRIGGLPDELDQQVTDGARRIRAAGSDAVLMDLQNSPLVTRSGTYKAMNAMIARAAQASGSGHFPRFELMLRANAAGVSQGDLVSWDFLHSTDAAYDCLGRAIARAIHAAAR
jgi:acyl-CoA thioesterase I